MISNKYLVVDKGVLPKYYVKVAEAKKLLETGKAKDVTSAVKMVGISRSTYYKYKDCVMEITQGTQSQRAIISMTLEHETGVLASVISVIASYTYSIWSIVQNPPIADRANVVIAMDISDGSGDIDAMIYDIGLQKGVTNVSLIGIE